MPDRVALISPGPMTTANGIGAQLLHLVAEDFPAYDHFWFSVPWSRGASIVPRSFEMGRFHRWCGAWPWRRGRGFIHRISRPFDPLDACGELRPGIFERALARSGSTFAYAYVTPICEAEAKPILAMVRRLGCPYLVQLWDLTHHESPITTEVMPALCALLRGAAAVYCLTQEIADAVTIPGVTVSGLLSFGRPTPNAPVDPPAGDRPLRIAMMGGSTDYGSGMHPFVQAWSQLDVAGSPCELVYLGLPTLLAHLPAGMRIERHGFISQAAREDLLHSCHLAFVSGPAGDPAHELLSRYSVPSRIGDYLHHGLPVIANFHPRSAALGFFSEAIDRSVLVANTKAQVIAAVRRLRDPAAWREASANARHFAQTHLDHRRVRAQVLAHIRPHLGRPAGSSAGV